MSWRIEPNGRKCVTDITDFVKTLKNGKKIYFREEVGYRWGYVIVEEDPTEAVAESIKSGKPLCVSDLGIIDHSYEDGCWTERLDVDDLSKKEQKLLEEAWAPEDAGWEAYDGETYFYGDVTVTNEDEDIEE